MNQSFRNNKKERETGLEPAAQTLFGAQRVRRGAGPPDPPGA